MSRTLSIARRLCLVCCAAVVLSGGGVTAAEESEMVIGEGKYALPIPKGWERRQPRTNIVEHEFAVAAVEGDPADGRVTVMAAGGSVSDNLDRWFGQFSQPDGSSTRDKAVVDKLTVAGFPAHVVDIGGTFDDRPPFGGGGVKREDYRLLGAIIETKAGNYFIKLVGPDKTVAGQRDAFRKMVEGLTAK